MFTLEGRDLLLKRFLADVDSNIKEYCGSTKMVFEDRMEVGDGVAVRGFIKQIENNIINAIPEAIKNKPSLNLRVNFSGEGESTGITMITLTSMSKYLASKNYKFKETVFLGGSFDAVLSILRDVYLKLVNDAILQENVAVVNSAMQQIVERSGVGYSVEFTTPLGNEGKEIAYISNDKIVFVVDEERILGINDLLILSEPSEFISDEVIEDAINKEVETISGCLTTPMLVAIRGGSFVKYICGIKNNLKPMTMIRRTYNRNVEKLTGKKDCLCYYLTGGDNGEYAVLSRIDGVFEVILSAFYVSDFTNASSDDELLSKVAKFA